MLCASDAVTRPSHSRTGPTTSVSSSRASGPSRYGVDCVRSLTGSISIAQPINLVQPGKRVHVITRISLANALLLRLPASSNRRRRMAAALTLAISISNSANRSAPSDSRSLALNIRCARTRFHQALDLKKDLVFALATRQDLRIDATARALLTTRRRSHHRHPYRQSSRHRSHSTREAA